ncbi:hypothetical protein CWI38_0019p0050 [Hamiltosporidium tvaerminnensis]|uniref:Uncharacterized protein n=1 Tax=Hamiltosporidium tvaerminnensis TaxID=1176355 RepID=A0A4Q9M249_9MICR|nr:hypothetical protein CWI38_0019p0050 [Hamiltosporidium tvaerminnensis]
MNKCVADLYAEAVIGSTTGGTSGNPGIGGGTAGFENKEGSHEDKSLLFPISLAFFTG